MRTDILYEDPSIIVAYKPAGLAAQTARVGEADMVSELKNHLKGGYVGIIHRLDQPVEGLLAFAKTREAAAALTRQLGEGMLHKRYYAVVCGRPGHSKGELADHLRRTEGNRAEVVEEGQGGKPARLWYETLAHSEEKGISLLGIRIETGRFHQIRAQTAHAGFPILGDRKYGTADSAELSRKYHVKYTALCACELGLTHPVTDKELHFAVEPRGDIFHEFVWDDPGRQAETL